MALAIGFCEVRFVVSLPDSRMRFRVIEEVPDQTALS